MVNACLHHICSSIWSRVEIMWNKVNVVKRETYPSICWYIIHGTISTQEYSFHLVQFKRKGLNCNDCFSETLIVTRVLFRLFKKLPFKVAHHTWIKFLKSIRNTCSLMTNNEVTYDRYECSKIKWTIIFW